MELRSGRLAALAAVAGMAGEWAPVPENLEKLAQAKMRTEHAKKKGPLADMPSFGLRDLKGKGATDMWLSGVPIERIQLLCGHKDKGTTERYIKQRWRETAQPNTVNARA